MNNQKQNLFVTKFEFYKIIVIINRAACPSNVTAIIDVNCASRWCLGQRRGGKLFRFECQHYELLAMIFIKLAFARSSYLLQVK